MAPRATSKVLCRLGLRHIRMLTAVTFVACLTACINPKHLELQTTGTITGRILDSVTLQPIAAATISDELDRLANADPEGGFAMTIPSGTHHLLIHANGYQTMQEDVTVVPHTTTLITKDGYERMQAVAVPK